MDFKRFRSLYLIGLLLLVACSQAAIPQATAIPIKSTEIPVASLIPTASPQNAGFQTPSPQAANSQTPTITGDPATVIGILISKETGQPLPDAVVRLAEVTRQGDQGMFVLDAGRSPAARTDAKGAFTIENVPPAEYVMLLQISEGIYSAAKDDSGKPLTWVAEAGQELDTGQVTIKTTIP